MNHFIALNWFRYLTSFLREKLCNRPGHYSITPKTLLLVSICCLGYQSQSKPHEWCLFASAAPADIRKATDMNISCDSILMRPHTQKWSVCSLYLQCSHGEAPHVVPEDQGALRPSGGDDRSLEVSGLTVSTVWTVCIHIPPLGAVAIRGISGIQNKISNSAAELRQKWGVKSALVMSLAWVPWIYWQRALHWNWQLYFYLV